MNKMTKGALATGLGIALLIGGGGTLAVWNATDFAEPGTIVSGNLELAATTGTWTNTQGEPITDINAYKLVPGEKLTFTQLLDVKLEGDQMRANLAVTQGLGTAGPLDISQTLLTGDKDNPVVSGPLTPETDGEFTAAVTVELKDGITVADGAGRTVDLGELNFALTQVAPITAAAASTLP